MIKKVTNSKAKKEKSEVKSSAAKRTKRASPKVKAKKVLPQKKKAAVKILPAYTQAPMPSVGSLAPDFSLPDQYGAIQMLSKQRGKWVLIYFYPKDDTPGCTKEACLIRDGFPFFEALDVTVFGVSVDSVKSHLKFAEKYNLPFTLLSDEEKKVVELYGVWGKKKFMGREYMGTNRASFLVNPKGIVAKVYPQVDPSTHANDVLADIKVLRK